jgi:putative transport protein
MAWLIDWSTAQPIAFAILALCAVIVGGLILGSVKVRGIRLGSAGVLFAGIVFSHFGAGVDHGILDFVKDFGLVLFVFMIGLQLGPGFFGSLRRNGLRHNALAMAVVVLGTGLALGVGAAMGLLPAGIVGVLAGATTNTPSLGAAQQALSAMPAVADAGVELATLGYAVAYPLGILGIIGALVIVRAVFRIDPAAEGAALDAQREGHAPVMRRTIEVRNTNLEGVALARLPRIHDFGVQVSRYRRAGSAAVHVAHGSTVLHVGDAIVVVGPEAELDAFERIVGARLEEDLTTIPGDITFRRVIVTRKGVLGAMLSELHLGQRFGVKVTRVIRSGVELAAFNTLRLQFGDVLHLIGDSASLERAGSALGNSPRALDETHFMPIFLGIALGVVLGAVPIALPMVPEPVRLGLAGGPLIVAILLSRIGNIGPLVWYVPNSARLAFRELGITLFLAGVGLKAGEGFVATVVSDRGLLWMGLAAIVAIVPPVVVGVVARATMKMNYATLAGVLSGSMTDPPALAFASGVCRSEAPFLAYATVYPATMVVRVVVVQVLVVAML